MALSSHLQIGVGESGGLKALLAAVDEEDEAQSALAAKALASVVCGTPALQEVLLDAGGADVLIRHLDAPEMPQTDEKNKREGDDYARCISVTKSPCCIRISIKCQKMVDSVSATEQVAENISAALGKPALVRDVLLKLLQEHESIFHMWHYCCSVQASRKMTVLAWKCGRAVSFPRQALLEHARERRWQKQ